MVKCRACKVLENPPPPGHDDWVYLVALNDAQLGIKPRLCQRHQEILQKGGVNDQIVSAAATWDALAEQEERVEANRVKAS